MIRVMYLSLVRITKEGGTTFCSVRQTVCKRQAGSAMSRKSGNAKNRKRVSTLAANILY